MKSVLAALLFFTFPASADDVGYSRSDWEKMFSGNVAIALNTNFAFLAKSLMDGALTMEAQVEQNVVLAQMVAARMRQTEENLRGAGVKNPAPALKDSRLFMQAGESIRLHTDQLVALQARLQRAYKVACEPETIKRLNGTFTSSGYVQVKGMLEDINQKIADVQKNGIDGISVQVGYYNGMQNQGGGTVYGNDADMAKIQSGIITGFMAAGVIIGTAIPVIGNVLGGIIGFIIGVIVSWIVGLIFGSPTFKIVDILREQSQHICESIDSLERHGIIEPSIRFCNLHLKNPDLAAVLADVDQRVAKLNGNIQSSLEEVKKSGETIDTIYKDELQRLKNDVYPTVQALVNDKFEACYADIKLRSDEGKKYASTQLVGPLKLFLATETDPGGRFQAEKDLWAKLVEGDIRYAATNAFGFQKEASYEAKELMAWDGIAKAVYTKLDQRFSAEKETGK